MYFEIQSGVFWDTIWCILRRKTAILSAVIFDYAVQKNFWGSTAPGSWRVCQPSHSNSFVTHPDSQWRFPVIFLQIGLLFFVLLRYSLYVSGDVSGDWFNIHKCTDFSSLAEPKPSLPLNTPRELATPRRYYPENNKDERMIGKPELSRPPGRQDRPSYIMKYGQCSKR